MILWWLFTTLREVAGLFKGWYFRPVTLGKPWSNQAEDLLGGLLVGGWVEGWDPGCGGPWHGDTFEWGRYYEGEWEGVRTQDKLCIVFSLRKHIWYLQLHVQTKDVSALTLTWIKWIPCPLPLSHSFSPSPTPSLPLCPALSRSRWLGHTAIFAFSCIIQSAAHSRSQWGVVCALVCPLSCDVVSEELCSCVCVRAKSIVTVLSTFVLKHCKCFS